MTFKQGTLGLLLLAAMSLSACSDNQKGSTPANPGQDSDNNRPATNLNANQGGASGGGAETCLRDATEQPCALLTTEVTKDIVPDGVVPEAKTHAGLFDCTAAWQGGREQAVKVGEMSMSVPTDDRLVVSGIRELADELERAENLFAAQYRVRGDEEKARIAKQAAESAEKQVADRHKDMVGDFAKQLVDSMDFEPVEDVGDAAAWGGPARNPQLVVRSGRMVFKVQLVRSDDADEVRDDSIRAARAILEGCS